MKPLNASMFVLLIVAAGCVTKGTHNRIVQENLTLKGKIGDLEEKYNNLELDMYSAALEQDSIKNKLEETSSTYENLVKDMAQEIQDGQITITRLKDKLTMNIVDKILFPTGQAEVKKEGMEVLNRIGGILKSITDQQIRIEGHTDNVRIGKNLQHKFPTNWELSTTRATNVVRYLIDVVGVNPRFISVAGYASYKPIDTNDTEEGRAHNRRIELILLPLEAGTTIQSLLETGTPVQPSLETGTTVQQPLP